MLVLSRKLGESIVIGGKVVLTPLKMKGGQVQFGIEAPREIVVDRGEVDAAKRATARYADAESHFELGGEG